MTGAPALLILCASAMAAAQDPAEPVTAPLTQAREEVHAPLDRAGNYLLTRQNEDGSWGSNAPESTLELGFALESYYSWKLASQGLICMALAVLDETPEIRSALEEAVEYLCSTRMSRRGSDWDIDYVWTAVYGFVACVELIQDRRLAEDPWKTKLETRGKEFLTVLQKHQALSGGWAYYDDPPFDVVPTWATSFTTAAVLPSLYEAREVLGWPVEQRMLDRAVRYVRRCSLPNGAYSYDLTPVTRIGGVEHINRVEGSLGRIQACNWALRRLGDEKITDETLREGLEALFVDHGFLDHVRTRPVPHEGYHANAGYFYFFAHYYAGKVIDLLPEEEREPLHARLRPHLTKTQWASGGMSDFLDSPYLVNASTSMFILALTDGLAPAGEER